MDIIEPKYIYAEKKIREAVKKLEADDKLPGERIFAKQLGISYMTARKAVDNLVAEGLLYKIPKRGAFVAGRKAARKKTKNIAYFLDNSIKGGLTSPYYSLIFDAVEKAATKSGYALMYFSDISEFNSQRNMKKIDGIIISCFPRIENIIGIMKEQVPVVCIDNCSSDKSIPSVTIDNYKAVVESIDYLCSLGHQRIGFITGLDDSDVGNNRLAGYISALNNCGTCEYPELIFKGDYSFQTGAKGADYLLSLDTPPTAIMCANDTMAIGAIKKIYQRGFNVPGDVSVIGFDDISVASHMTPALTTISAPINGIAKHSVDMLNSMINGIKPDNSHITLPGHLVLRDSCAAMENKTVAARKQRQ